MAFNFQGWDAQMQQQHNMYPPTPVKDGLWRGTSLGGGMGIYPVETRKAIERELEKERIREEILVEEIARKRDLEAEVRREIAIEMAMAMHCGPRPPPFVPVSFEEKFGRHCEIGRFLGKPNGGAKGKPAGAASSEWSCAVCKVSAPCEDAFKQHLVGKKHQAQMAALKAKNTQKHSTQNKPFKKQSGEIGLGVIKSTNTLETESSKTNKSVKTQQPPPLKKNNSNNKYGSQKEDDKKNSNNKCDSKKEEDKKKNSNNKCDSEKEEDKKKNSNNKCDSKKDEDKKSELWFSCEMCKVGASSHEVMNAHIRGKKHLNNLLKLHQESKKPHKAETEVGVKDEKSMGKTQVADSGSIGSLVFNATYSSYL